MDLGIAGKVALVSAGSKGLGRAIATELAAEGARVGICARNRDALEQAADEINRATHAEVLTVVADVSQPADCESFVSAARELWGRIDILVNNSGGPAPGSFETTDDATWAAAVETTLMNVVRLTRLVLPDMKRQKWGRIVNVESISVAQPIDGLLLSNSIRPAVVGLSKTLADELAPFGVLINTICPGSHATDRLRELAESRAAKNGTSADDELRNMAQSIPVGRLGKPEELAAVAAFLCSARASFVTGTTIVVDGGGCRAVT